MGAMPVFAQPALSPPARIYTPIWGESTDQQPSIAKGPDDTWIAIWWSNDTIDDPEQSQHYDPYVSRSLDDGANWTFPALLSPGSDGGSRADREKSLPSDGTGNLILAWETAEDYGLGLGSDIDLVVSRSTDYGLTWSAPVLLNSFGVSDDVIDEHVRVCFDGHGAWVAVWRSRENATSGANSDFDIFTSRSVDVGATWSPAVLLNTYGRMDVAQDNSPSVTSDGNGTVIAGWSGEGGLSGPTGDDEDVFFARSVDGGATWTQSALFDKDGYMDSSTDRHVRLAGDGTGQWIAAWSSTGDVEGKPDEPHIVVARSNDGGRTWTTPRLLDAGIPDEASKDLIPQPATDRAGNWIVVWQREQFVSGSDGMREIPYLAWSGDAGKSWSAPALLDPNGLSEFSFIAGFDVAAGANGSWLALWSSTLDVTGANADGHHLLYTRFQLEPIRQLRVIRPNGGERLVRGFKWPIRWNSVGDTGSNVRIHLIKNGQKVKRIRKSTPNDGVCPWFIKPERFPIGDGYKIRIIPLENKSAKDVSDGTFSITDP
jgi:hypothetical protein